MKTQSPDTHPKIEAMLIEAYRKMNAQEKMRRVPDNESILLASAEDMILQKLHRYRLTGERSDRQWLDVQGILKVQGAAALELDYLHHWAAELSLSDVMERAFEDAGIGSDPMPPGIA